MLRGWGVRMKRGDPHRGVPGLRLDLRQPEVHSLQPLRRHVLDPSQQYIRARMIKVGEDARTSNGRVLTNPQEISAPSPARTHSIIPKAILSESQECCV